MPNFISAEKDGNKARMEFPSVTRCCEIAQRLANHGVTCSAPQYSSVPLVRSDTEMDQAMKFLDLIL